MNWEKIYLGCFSFGFLMSLASFMAHSLHAHLPGHAAHLGHPASHGGFPKINLTTLSAFLTWFGGVGYLLLRYSTFGFYIAMGDAAASGMVAAYVVYMFVAKVLMRNEGELRQIDYEMVGMLGRVSSPIIGEKGIGEMIYSHEGVRRHVAIRSEQMAPIAKGIEVVVTRYERGVAHVRRWDELSGL